MATENLSGKSDEMLEVNPPVDKHPSQESNSAFKCLDNVPMKLWHTLTGLAWRFLQSHADLAFTVFRGQRQYLNVDVWQM